MFGGSATNSFTVPAFITMRTSSYFCFGHDARRVGSSLSVGRQLPHCRAHALVPRPLENSLQEAGGRAAHRGGEMVFLDVDHPGAAAERSAAEGDIVTGVEFALRKHRRCCAVASAAMAAREHETGNVESIAAGANIKCPSFRAAVARAPEPERPGHGVGRGKWQEVRPRQKGLPCHLGPIKADRRQVVDPQSSASERGAG